MVGLSDVFWVYQNSGPALLFVLIAGGAYLWKYDIQPRFDDLEQTQEERAERWEEQALNSQERALLLDDAQSRVQQVEDAMDRMKTRIREIEQAYAVDHGSAPGGFEADSDAADGFCDAADDDGGR